MSVKIVLIAVFVGVVLVISALLVQSLLPWIGSGEPKPEFVSASGKCAQCHRHETPAIVHQFEASDHAAVDVDCYECHRVLEGQDEVEHNGFIIAETPTSANCRQCHTGEYNQYVRSRHAAPAWGAVKGVEGFTSEQVEFAEKYHPGTVTRQANSLAIAEGAGVLEKGCLGCHSIGEPNIDGTIGSCTQCHSAHFTSVELARQPQTCGQCHMGPDHSQIEIYNESKHGILFAMQKERMNLAADPKELSTEDMSVPTCATCHMSGLEGAKVSHNTGDRLSYYLFAAISNKRPAFNRAQADMKEICLNCHATSHVDTFYGEAEAVVEATNAKVQESINLMAELRHDGLLTPEPFDEPMEFLAFDYWHYYGRTAKHGAFMGGADFVQWHGNYELLLKIVEMKDMAEELKENR